MIDLEKKLIQQSRYPIVPSLGSSGLGVGYGEEIEHLQFLDAAEFSSTLNHHLFIIEIPLGGGFGQQQVFPNQKRDGVNVINAEVQPLEYLGDNFGALFGMIFSLPTFPYIVEQNRPEEQLPATMLPATARGTGGTDRTGKFLEELAVE